MDEDIKSAVIGGEEALAFADVAEIHRFATLPIEH